MALGVVAAMLLAMVATTAGATSAGASDPGCATSVDPSATCTPGVITGHGSATVSSTSVQPAVCPATTANGRFVRWIYLNILFRCPETDGAAFWVDQLDHGMPLRAFAWLVDMSDENIFINNVNALYADLLNRAPSPVEAELGAENIRGNEGDARLIAELGSSDEFYSHIDGATPQLKDQAWLAFAYNAVLDRAPDTAGAAFFTGILGPNGSTEATRRQVAIALEFSSENAGGWIRGVYGAAFQRPPDDAGFAYWQNWLLTTGFRTFRMWTEFLSSPEGWDKAQTQPDPPPDGQTHNAHSVNTLQP